MATLGELIVTVGASIEGFSSAMKEVSDTIVRVGDTAKDGLEHLDKFQEKLLELAAAAGIATGGMEILKEALGTFAKAQDVQTSFALLTGSTTAATDAFDGLKEMATNLAIPFEQLISVSQRLAPQFGVGTQAMADVLTGAADAARATGNSFDTVAQSLDRIALSGTITTRQMNSLQISIQDIADAMGTSVAEATAKIKKGGQSAQEDMTVILAAISEKYGGAAEAMSTGLTGLFTNMKNQLGFVSDDLGKALAPLAEDLIAGIKDMEPALQGIANSAALAVTGFLDVGKALAGLLPDFLKMIFSGQSMVGLGTAIGFIGATLGALATTAHSALLVMGDLATLNFSRLKTDTDDITKAMHDAWVTNFQDIAKKGDDLSKTLGDIKIPVFGDTVGNAGAATTAMSNMAEMAKALKEATKDLAMADKDHAEYLKASYVPAITTVEDAESKLHDARLVYLAADQAEQTTRQALLEAQKNKTADLITIEATLKDQSKTTKDAHIAYTEALKDQQLAKTTLTTATKDILAAEADIAAALKANYIPALLDHKTALDNIVAAEANQKAAIEAVGVAEVNLQNAMPKPGSPGDPVAIKAAEDALATTRQNLKDAVVKLTEAHKDEVTSLNLLQSVQKDIDATDKLLIANKKLLLPATRDMVAAIKDYDSALADARTADQTLRDAEQDLINVRNSGPTGQQLKDALDKEKAAKDAVTLANAKLSDATRTLTTDFKANRDTIDELTRHTGDWTESQKVAAAALVDMGIKSGQALDDLAKKAADDFEAISSSESTSLEERRQANIKFLQDKLDADVQNGRDISAAQQLDLAKLKQQETDYRTDSVTQWATLYTTIDGDVKSFTQSAIATLITGKGSFKDEVVTMLDNIAIAVADTFLKKATDAIAQFIAGALTDLLSGKGLGGVLQSLKDIGTAATSVFKGIGGTAGNIGAAGTGAIGDTVASGDTLAGVGGGGGATGAIGGAVGTGLSSIFGMVTGAITAVTSVISVFQNMHQETSLNAIEANTRITSILLGSIDATGKNPQDADNIKTWTKTIGVTLQENLPSMRTALDGINATTQNMRQDTFGILTNLNSMLGEIILDLQLIALGGSASTGAGVTADQITLLSDATRNANGAVTTAFQNLQASLGVVGNHIVDAIATAQQFLNPDKITGKLDTVQAQLLLGLDNLGKSIDKSLNPLGTFGEILKVIQGGISGITGGIGSAIGGLTGGGVIGGVVDALTGGGRQETTLNAIELNTRISSILLGSVDATGKAYQDADNVKVWTKTIGVTILEIKAMLYDTIHNDLVGIWSAVGAGGGASTAATAVADQSIGIINELKNIEGFNWGTLHADLVGIWNEATGIKDNIIAMATKLANSSAGAVTAVLSQSPSLSYDSSKMVGNDVASASVVATLNRMAATSGAAGIIDLSSVTEPLKSLVDLVTAGFGRMADFGSLLHTDLLKIDQLSNIEASIIPQLASVRDAVIMGAQSIIADRQGTPSPLIKIFLDGRELAQSYGVYLSQSGTVAPAAA